MSRIGKSLVEQLHAAIYTYCDDVGLGRESADKIKDATKRLRMAEIPDTTLGFRRLSSMVRAAHSSSTRQHRISRVDQVDDSQRLA